ncbi:alpha-hydroxy acid oxidase [Hoeflea ulvae]|uniref:Alpha-hydroxy-acid oxidizing protein n=1 Tax=Hoeflea ulvae TaxID=2983764 RepID=A0ABT3YM05_9HYPH|nr:alpha-hydroxy acid oxidase [Hoeflea ulvae]MCY0096907.1 alpha-hydroxy-acid oxidizing protein [Hoeflea ulvae]
MSGFLSFEEARRSARRRLPRGLFDYIDRGVGEEASLRALRTRLDAAGITPRMLTGADASDTGVTLFGEQHQAPFIIAPTAMAGLVHRGGEEALARGAARCGVPFCLSTQSLSSVEQIAGAAPGLDIWMQIYLWQDLALSEALLSRAWDTGVRVAVMTIDTPAGSRKEWNLRSGFDMPFRLSPRSLCDLALRPNWLFGAVLPRAIRHGLPAMNNYPEALRPRLIGAPVDPRVTLMKGLNWDHVRWLRDRWAGKLVLKGILSCADAETAIGIGADGIVVSSHGARNFDASPAPIDVLQDIASACEGRLTVMADSGVRRGLDVLRYRRRGAEAVMLGRLPLWALAAEGETGVVKALSILREEYAESLRYSA